MSEEEKVTVRWRDALDMPSASQVGYMRQFFEQIDWQDLIPRFHNLAYFVPSSNVLAYFAGTWFAGTRPDDTDMVLLIQKA